MTENENYIEVTEDDIVLEDEAMTPDPAIDLDWDGEPGSMAEYADDTEPPLEEADEVQEEGTE